MSLIRGKTYCWSSDDALHIWTAEYRDFHMPQSGWAQDYPPLAVAGIALPHALMQEIAVMLVAAMSDTQREAAEKRAVEKWGGNLGCLPLARKRGDKTPWD